MTNEEKIIGDIYDFAKDRLKDTEVRPNSPKDNWKQMGKAELLGELFHYLKELRETYKII